MDKNVGFESDCGVFSVAWLHGTHKHSEEDDASQSSRSSPLDAETARFLADLQLHFSKLEVVPSIKASQQRGISGLPAASAAEPMTVGLLHRWSSHHEALAAERNGAQQQQSNSFFGRLYKEQLVLTGAGFGELNYAELEKPEVGLRHVRMLALDYNRLSSLSCGIQEDAAASPHVVGGAEAPSSVLTRRLDPRVTANLVCLGLSNNRIASIAALLLRTRESGGGSGSSCPEICLPNLVALDLSRNQLKTFSEDVLSRGFVEDEFVDESSSAVGGEEEPFFSAMADEDSSTILRVRHGGHEEGALPSLRILLLGENRIGPDLAALEGLRHVAQRGGLEVLDYDLGIFTPRRFTAGNVWGNFNGRGLTTSS